MQRIRQRKYGRDGNSPHALQATHVIKIGFNLLDPGSDQPGKRPGKLRGFLLCRDGVDEDGRLIVDMSCMAKYSVTKESIATAKQLQFKAPVGILPTELQFVLVHDARKDVGRWVYPGTFGEEYELWGGKMRACHGDGVVAFRKQEDGTKKSIECVPKAKEGAPVDAWCPYSVDGKCKTKSRLVLCLWKNDAHGRHMPVSDAFGWEARFRFDTTSEYNPMGFLQALDAAAERLHGNIAGIPGKLSFSVKPRPTGTGTGLVGHVQMMLSNAAISKRERELWERQIEEHKVYALAPGQQALPEHESPASERETEEEEIVVQEYGGDDFVMPEDAKPVGESPFVDDSGGDASEEPAADDKPPVAALHEQVLRAHEILLRDFPDAGGPLGFELNSEWGVERIEDVPEEYHADLLALLRNVYREERKGARQ